MTWAWINNTQWTYCSSTSPSPPPKGGETKVHHLNGPKWVLKEVQVRNRRSTKNAGLVHVPLSISSCLSLWSRLGQVLTGKTGTRFFCYKNQLICTEARYLFLALLELQLFKNCSECSAFRMEVRRLAFSKILPFVAYSRFSVGSRDDALVK